VEAPDENTLSEINILPDGRIYVFGTSREVLEVLETLTSRNERVQRLLESVHQVGTGNEVSRSLGDAGGLTPHTQGE
jgi:hypothetical protein